ncbi:MULTISPECIES: DUF4397 domain-containing protein [Spirosoma]|uniref:DUF4397 domain-containing protein n=1 Tax=Spirosoma liriopis TaxID=2937440 RepID=A0ABT0HL16_9BACT|nr:MULTISPECIES: DUF4397 domain-containing protein [Spirosoma]MCK8492577.1 DUF4397 domain-containing protein [Spirosoma liriopis]UHG92046.1 DUF4397 domain-containing protein [Spirosoma oryzicola]
MRSILTTLLLVSAGLLLLACGDEANFLNSVAPATGARVKFYHLAPDAAGIDIYVNDQKFSGVNTVPPATSLPLSYTNSFPNQDYATITPGTAKVRAVAPASTTASSDATLATTDLTVQDNTYTSVFFYGNSPTYNSLVLTDNLTAADPTKAYVRLINFVSGADASATYDLAINGVVVASGIAPLKGSAAFTAIPSIAFATTAVPAQLRLTGTTTVVGTAYTIQPYAGRFYTFIARGVVGGTGTRAPNLTISTNR